MLFLRQHGAGHLRMTMGAMLWLVISALPGALAKNQTVTSSDPRIQYTNNTEWTDQDNGGHKFSGNIHAGASFTFTGSAIYYLSSINPNGAIAAISIDGHDNMTVDQSKGTKTGDQVVPSAVLFSQTDLSAGQNHTIQVSWQGLGAFGGSYLEIYGFIYDDALGTTTTSAASSSPTVSSPHGSSDSSSTNKSNAAVIGGAVGGSIGGLLVGGLLVFCLFRLRRRPSSTADSKRAEAYSYGSRPNVGRTGTDIEEDKPEASVPASTPGPSRIRHEGSESSGSNELANSVALHTLSSLPRRSTSETPQVHTSSASIDTTASPMPVPSARHGYGIGLQVQATSSTPPTSPERGLGPGKIAAAARARILAGQTAEETQNVPQPQTSVASVSTAASPPVRALPIPEPAGTRPESDVAPPVYTERPS